MRNPYTRWAVARASHATALALLALAALGAGAEAQPLPSVELRGGFAIPAGDLDEVGEPGPGVGIGFGIPLTDRLALRLDGDLEVFGKEKVGSDVLLPRTYLYHYQAGLELEVLDPASAIWHVRVRAGAGGTTYDTEEFAEGEAGFLDTYFSAGGALSVGRTVARRLEMGITGQAFFVFTDEARTDQIARRSPLLNPFPTASSFPVQLYLRWSP